MPQCLVCSLEISQGRDTGDMKRMSTVELQIAERARKFTEEPLTNLSQFITCDMLDKWLKAGILEDETLSYPQKGTQ